MKKLLILLVVSLMNFLFFSCNNSTTVQTTMSEDSFIPIYSNIVDSILATFAVSIDCAEINSINDTITVTVEMTAKEDIDHELGTSSYGDLGIIHIRIVSGDDDEIALYSEFYDIPVTEDLFTVHIETGDKLTRTIRFSRLPFHGGTGGEQPSPTGVYKVQVALWLSDIIWINGIIVRVMD